MLDAVLGDVDRDRHREGRARAGASEFGQHIGLLAAVAAILHLRRHVDRQALIATPCRPSCSTASASAASTTASTTTGSLREVMGEAQCDVVRRRIARGHVVEVTAGAIQVRHRDESQQRERRLVQLSLRNLIARKGLAGRRIDQRSAQRRKIARALRQRRHGGVLIEEVGAAIPTVGQSKGRPARSVIDAWDDHRPTQRHAKVLAAVGVCDRRRIRPQLVGRRFERRPAVAVVGRRLEQALPAAATATDLEVARAAASSRAAAPAGPTGAASAPRPLRRLRTRRKRAGGGVKFAAGDRAQPVAHHAAIDARHLSVDGNRLIREFSGKPWRQQSHRGLFGLPVGRRHLQGGRSRLVCLHIQRGKALASPSDHRRGRRKRRGRRCHHRVRHSRREHQRKIRLRLARRLAHGHHLFTTREGGHLHGDPILGPRGNRQFVGTINRRRGGGHQAFAGPHGDRNTRQWRDATQHPAGHGARGRRLLGAQRRQRRPRQCGSQCS